MTQLQQPISPALTEAVREPRRSLWGNWAWVLLFLGIGWRVTRLFAQFPFWKDEAALALNLFNRPILDLRPPMLLDQVQPPLFAAGTQILRMVLGSGEWVFRLIPLLAGIAAILLFSRFGRRILDPLGLAMAVGLMAISTVTVQLSVEYKPYSVDLLVAVLYLFIAAKILERPDRVRYFVVLLFLMPLSVGISLPSVFLVCSIFCVLMPVVIKKTPAMGIALYLLGNVLAGGAFFYVLGIFSASAHYRQTMEIMVTHWWKGSFPPGNLWGSIVWFVQIHLGAVSAYPVKAYNICNIFMCAFAGLGIIRLAIQKKFQLLALLLLPYFFTLLAACFRRYPYGGEARIAQHLLPSFLILTALGFSATMNKLGKFSPRLAGVVPHVLFGGFFALGVAGIIGDLHKPYYFSPNDLAARAVNQSLAARIPDGTSVYAPEIETLPKVFTWYFQRDLSPIRFNQRPDFAGSFVQLVPPARKNEPGQAVFSTDPATVPAGWTCRLLGSFASNPEGEDKSVYRVYFFEKPR